MGRRISGGAGQTFLGATSVTTGANGAASFNANLPVAVPVDQVVSANTFP